MPGTRLGDRDSKKNSSTDDAILNVSWKPNTSSGREMPPPPPAGHAVARTRYGEDDPREDKGEKQENEEEIQTLGCREKKHDE